MKVKYRMGKEKATGLRVSERVREGRPDWRKENIITKTTVHYLWYFVCSYEDR